MGNTLKVIYKFGAWQTLYRKNQFDLNIFLFHMKNERKIISYPARIFVFKHALNRNQNS